MAVWKTVLVVLLLGLFGLGIWLSVSALRGETEAWESPLSLLYGLPIIIVLPFAAGYFLPRNFKLWGFAVFLFHPLVLFTEGGSGTLFFAGVFLAAVLAGICTLFSFFGYLLRQKQLARSAGSEEIS